jgi:ankyrin repeat protein
MVHGFTKEYIDSVDKSNGSTPLIIACETSKDLVLIEILVDGGSDVNAVNRDNAMPLNVIKTRMKQQPEDEDL